MAGRLCYKHGSFVLAFSAERSFLTFAEQTTALLKNLRSIYCLLDPLTRKRLPVSALMGLTVSVMEAGGIGMLYPFLLGLSDPASMDRMLGKINQLTGWSVGEGGFALFGIMAGLLLVAKNLLAIGVSFWQTRFLYEAEGKLSERLVKAYMDMPYLKLSQCNSAELVSNVHNVVGTVIGALVLPILGLMTEATMVAATILVLIAVDPVIAISVGGFLTVTALLLQIMLRRRLRRLGQISLQSNSGILHSLNHIFGGIREIRIYCRQEAFFAQFKKQRKLLTEFRRSQVFLNSLPRYYLELMLLLGIGIVLAAAMSERSRANLIATMVVFIAGGLRLMPSYNRVMALAQQIRVALPAAFRLEEEFIRTKPDELRSAASSAESISNKQGLEIEGLTFTFPETGQKIFDNLNLTIAKGEVVGLVGSSGAGKTTLIYLLLGLYRAAAGRILVDGVNIETNLDAWRSRIGYVPQDIYLLDDTMRANIAFGIDPAKVNEKALQRAVVQAELSDLVASLPKGMDTRLGERGVRLSGGQKQRISIARALYGNPEYLILDEATSALDNETESKITETINTLHGEHTMLIIAHRLSTVKQCDRLILMRDGQVAASGDFDSLNATNEEFANLVRLAALSPQHIF
jgi:ATP-binding cassette subfamily C protein